MFRTECNCTLFDKTCTSLTEKVSLYALDMLPYIAGLINLCVRCLIHGHLLQRQHYPEESLGVST
jgi:hypothetical protein